jgi:hypothetical protein
MIKILSLIVLILSFSALGQSKCSFTRHHHVEVDGKDVTKVLRHKILNDFNPDKVIVQKINEELGVKLCATFKPFHDFKDILAIGKPKEEQILTKVALTPDKKGFWLLTIESFVRKNEKEVTQFSAAETFTSAKSIKDIKDSEIVGWVSSKLLVLTK